MDKLDSGPKTPRFKIYPGADERSSTPANAPETEQDIQRRRSESIKSTHSERKSESPRRNFNDAIYSQRIILTTYPGQLGMNPIPLVWGAADPQTRGPVIASRIPESMK